MVDWGHAAETAGGTQAGAQQAGAAAGAGLGGAFGGPLGAELGAEIGGDLVGDLWDAISGVFGCHGAPQHAAGYGHDDADILIGLLPLSTHHSHGRFCGSGDTNCWKMGVADYIKPIVFQIGMPPLPANARADLANILTLPQPRTTHASRMAIDQSLWGPSAAAIYALPQFKRWQENAQAAKAGSPLPHPELVPQPGTPGSAMGPIIGGGAGAGGPRGSPFVEPGAVYGVRMLKIGGTWYGPPNRVWAIDRVKADVRSGKVTKPAQIYLDSPLW